jgi:prolyl-tRNA editing enzyme YbaK/EbsC (Cys-tRNA(Pro) deacylase)
MTETKGAEAAVLALLEASGEPFERLACDPAFADTAAFCARYEYPLEKAGNTLLVATQRPPRRYAAFIVPASRRLDVNRTARRLMGGEKVSFATPEETAARTGQLLGGVTPFTLPADIPVFIDEGLLALDFVIVGAGSRSAKIRMAPRGILRVIKAEVVAGLAVPRPGTSTGGQEIQP